MVLVKSIPDVKGFMMGIILGPLGGLFFPLLFFYVRVCICGVLVFGLLGQLVPLELRHSLQQL